MANNQLRGLTLIEVLIVVSIIALFSLMVITTGKFLTQIKKGRDAKRKADLSSLQKVLEDYYGDKGHYPKELPCGGETLKPYLNNIPCDPVSNMKYEYVVDPDNPNQSQWYIIFTKLEYESDPIIEKRACRDGCEKEGVIYNYLVTSPNLSTSVLETIIAIVAPPPPSPTPTEPGVTLTPTPPPGPLPTATPSPEPLCPGGTTPRPWDPDVYGDCLNPAAYCPPQGETGCCASGTLYCSDSNYWCCIL